MTNKPVHESKPNDATDYDIVLEGLKETGCLGDIYQPEYSDHFLIYSIFDSSLDGFGCFNSYLLFWDDGDFVAYTHTTNPLDASVFKDHDSAKFMLDKVKVDYPRSNISKVKYLLEKYYIITYTPLSVHVQIEWANETIIQGKIDGFNNDTIRCFKESQKDEFISKLKEVRVNILNNLHDQLLRVTETRKYEEL